MTEPVSPIVFDRLLRRKRLNRIAAEFGSVDFLKMRAVEDLIDRLDDVDRRFAAGLDLGSHGGRIASAMTAAKVDFVCSTDPVTGFGDGTDVVADEEHFPFKPASFDLVMSALSLHWVNDLPGTLIQARRVLKPDGLFVAVMFGGTTLHELRTSFLEAESELAGGASMRVSPFADALDMSQLLQRAGFALPVSDLDRITVRYDTPFHLMRDLRRMGETNLPVQRGRGLRRDVLHRMAEIYLDRFADPDGRIRATFDLIWMSGWAPSPAQPKPLRPGSAKTRLADALGAVEQSAGEGTGLPVTRRTKGR